MRVLGVDLGSKRIGVAVGETEFQIATPRPCLAALGSLQKDAIQVSALARAEEVAAIVLGVPVNEDDGRMERICQRFAEELRGLGWSVITQDESLTSIEAGARMEGSTRTAASRKKVLDSEAACIILERYFHANLA